MSLDLGALVGRVLIEDAEFQRSYARIQRQFAQLGQSAGKAAAGTGAMDRALTDTGASAGRAAAGVDKAAAAAARHADATARVAAVMAPLAEATNREQAAVLRLVAAQDRLNTVQASGAATTARLASAQASVVAATDRASAAQLAAMGATNKWRTAMSGVIRTAGELGLVIGVFEGIHAAIDLGHDAAQFQRQMLQIRTVANASAVEVQHMTTAVLGMAGDVGTAPDELAVSLYHVEQNGLRGAKALEVTATAAKGAKIGMADVEATTNSMTSAVASGISGVQDMDQAMGALLATVGTGDMKMEDLNDALSNGILSVAKTYGLSLHDVGAALAVFGDLNIRGRDAASQLRQAVMAFAKPAVGPAAKSMLEKLGMTTKTLAEDMQQGGLNQAVTDLRDRLHAAGIEGDQTGKALLDLFGKKAGIGVSVLIDQYDRLQVKYHELNEGAQSFAQKWAETQKTAGFQLERLGAEAKSTGIQLMQHLLPVGTEVVDLIATGIPHAVSVAEHALAPFGAAWHVVEAGMTPVVHVVGDLLHALGPAVPVFEGVGAAALAMWAAFKGYQLARLAVFAVMDTSAKAAAGVTNSFRSMQASMAGTASEGELTARVMQAEFAQIEVSALQAAAAHEQAGARIAAAYADQVAALTAATDAQVTNATELAAAQSAAARSAVTSAAVSTAAAEEAATAVGTAGAAARVGWASLAGPLGLAAVGVLTLVTMFHHSTKASKEATEAAKAYTDALHEDSRGTTIVDTIVKQLSDAKLPATLKQLNDELGQGTFNGAQFVAAIKTGGKPLDDLRAKLQGVVDVNRTYAESQYGQLVATGLTKTGQAAQKALDALNQQHSALTQAQQDEITQLKTFGMTATAIDQVTQSTHVASDAAATYAQMVGIAVDKNGVAAVSADKLEAAINTVSSAYNTASATGDGFLSALQSFATSAGTAADRAALIGATLKAANGDALAYAGAMAGAVDANRTFLADLRQASGAQKILDDAKTKHVSGTAAAEAANRKYLKSIIDLKTGTIDYTKAGATPLISDLQQIQDSAMQAAQAQYQHEVATKGGTKAADDAYNTYVARTRSSLIDQAKQLGITTKQASDLADQYFGMPDEVKTLIEQEGGGPVVTVLNQIGEQLSYLTGHPWVPMVKADTKPAAESAAQIQKQIDGIKQGKVPGIQVGTYEADAMIDGLQAKIDALHSKSITITAEYKDARGTSSTTYQEQVPGFTGQHKAAGGKVQDGFFTAGERGWELGYKQGPNVTFFSNPMSKAMTGWDRVPGFAGGTADAQRVSSAISAIGQTYSPPFDLTQTGSGRVAAQIRHAEAVLAQQIHAGLSRSAAASFRGQIDSLAREAQRQLGNLRLKIRGSDLDAVKSALKGTVEDTRTVLTQMLADARAAGASLAARNMLASTGYRLRRIQGHLATARDQLSTMTDYRSGISSTLAGGFDPSKYGSVQDLLAGLGSATSANEQYAGEVDALRNRAKGNKTLTGLIDQLAAQGDNTTLQTLFNASKGELAQVSKAAGAYNSSLSAGANAATTLHFGTSVAQQQQTITDLTRQQTAMAGAVSELAVAIAHRPITLNGQVLARYTDAQIEAAIRKLTNVAKSGRKTH